MMFVLFDEASSSILDGPSNIQKDGWLPIEMPPKRSSPAQSLHFVVANGVVTAEWAGSPNPGDAPASRDALNDATKYILQLPLAASDGKVFQFDTDSEAVMIKMVKFLKANSPATTDWRLLDNTTVTVGGTSLEAYYNELALAQAARLVIVDPQYLNYKNNGVTVAELAAWVKAYEDNPDITTIA